MSRFRVTAGGSHLRSFDLLMAAHKYAHEVLQQSHPNIGSVRVECLADETWIVETDYCAPAGTGQPTRIDPAMDDGTIDGASWFESMAQRSAGDHWRDGDSPDELAPRDCDVVATCWDCGGGLSELESTGDECPHCGHSLLRTL